MSWADPVPKVVSTEPRPEEGPRVRQRGLLSSNEIWRLQRYSSSIPCQRVRNQDLKTLGGPGQLLAPGRPAPCLPGAAGRGLPAMAVLVAGRVGGGASPAAAGRAVLRLCPQPLNFHVQRFQGPCSRCPRGDTRQWLSPTGAHLSLFYVHGTWTPALVRGRLSPAVTGESVGAQGRGPRGAGRSGGG